MNSAQLFFAALAWDLKKTGNSRLAESLSHLAAEDAQSLLGSMLKSNTVLEYLPTEPPQSTGISCTTR